MTYRRPYLDIGEFRDERGAVIDYGNRWESTPSNASYSVEPYPERFAPLLVVARALIDYVATTYDAATDISDEAAVFLPAGQAARLRFELDSESYTVRLEAGALAKYSFPSCGCDACDESVEDLAEDLEQTVFAVVSGRLIERVGPGKAYIELTRNDGGASSSESPIEWRDRRRMRRIGREIPDRWLPWLPKRSVDAGFADS